MNGRIPGMFVVMASLLGSIVSAHSAVVLEPTGDKYMYPFIPDTAPPSDYASTFGAYGAIDDPAYDFDDRDAQFFLDFDTSSLVQPGQGPANYQVQDLVVTIVVANNNAFFYDPSPDALSTYVDPQSDDDPGRPLEIYGVGYRSGWTADTFVETSPFQSQPSSPGNYNRKRNAYAMQFDSSGLPRDVSNNVEEGFEVTPWAVADTSGYIDYDGAFVARSISAGAMVPEGQVMEFRIDLSKVGVLSYVRDGLHRGRLRFMVSSLYGTVQSSEDVPKFYTKESFFHDPASGSYLAPQLEGNVTVQAPGPDSDGDGMADAWELEYFGHLDMDGTGDANANEVSDLDEYIFGNDPRDPIARRPEAMPQRLSGDTIRISFPTVAGRSYQVKYRRLLTGAGDTWMNLAGPITGDGQIKSVDDTGALGSAQRFYRVEVTPLPASD